VSRELVLELTDATEEHLPLRALSDTSEAFLTSTTRGVRPNSAVDGTPLPLVPGPLITAARAAYLARIEGDDDP
jgi:branched-subunit amino acid aminotransferase/4-amino-4-deoxychorismate lyase